MTSLYNHTTIKEENGVLALASPYNKNLVDAVKTLPYTERRYEPNRKVWLIDPKHGQQVVQWVRDYMGEVINLPVVTQYKGGQVMRLVEVRYLGACKMRDSDISAAFGLVGNDWSIVFPESVLRSWFDAGDVQPAPNAQQTLYQVLGIKKTASEDEIKTAFRRMTKQWHPDVCKEPNATEIFIHIRDAYALLSDIGKRARYDAGLALEATLNQKSKRSLEDLLSVYRAPLRCGNILVEGAYKVGRLEVSKILAWEDIVKNGKTLITSWPMGSDKPVEVWA